MNQDKIKNTTGNKVMEMKFSPIGEDDLVSCSELYVATFHESPWNEKWSMEEAFERFSDYLACPKSIAIKVEENEEICGFIFGKLQKCSGFTSYDLEEICVSSAVQRKGVGKALVGKLEQILMEKGVSKIYLVTQRDSIPSCFYSSLGFSENRDLAVMGKSIEPGSRKTDSRK